jgi:uncharacterized protein YdhG (YjbR/CyaY superfamily)
VKSADTTPSTLDEYIRAFPRDVRKKLTDLRATIRRAAPDATEKIAYRMPTFFQKKLSDLRATIHRAAPDATEKIAYRMPTFFLKKNLVHFAGYEHHIVFYPTPSGIAAFRDELTVYVTSKGAIQFPIDEPLPLELVTRIVKFRVAENEAKARVKKRTSL